MGKRETKIGDLCKELGITQQTLYRHIALDGVLQEDREKLLKKPNGIYIPFRESTSSTVAIFAD
jgi:phage antirepressor YoqD-like protein